MVEQLAGQVQVDVVAGRKEERFVFGPAGGEQPLEAPLVDARPTGRGWVWSWVLIESLLRFRVP